ncbi:MAG: hypothetical protein ACXWT7_06705 [Methylophilaceae bacterium]
MYIDSDFLEECAELWSTGIYTQLGLESYNNAFKLSNSDFLERFSSVNSIHINLNRVINLDGLEHIAETLEALDINDDLNLVRNLSPFKCLRSLRQNWGSDISFPEKMPLLETLGLAHFHPKIGNFNDLPEAPNLRKIGIVLARVSSFEGLQKYNLLTDLGFYRLAGLEDVSAIEHLTSLKEFELESCRGTYDISSAVKYCSELNKLTYINCPELNSLSFISHLPKLKEFIFPNTLVKDGNLSPLLNHPSLAQVLFTK